MRVHTDIELQIKEEMIKILYVMRKSKQAKIEMNYYKNLLEDLYAEKDKIEQQIIRGC